MFGYVLKLWVRNIVFTFIFIIIMSAFAILAFMPDEAFGELTQKGNVDKICHLMAFMVIGLVLFLAYINVPSKDVSELRVMLAVVIDCLVLGAAIELVQFAHIDRRDGELKDLYADFLGSLVGGVLIPVLLMIPLEGELALTRMTRKIRPYILPARLIN